MIKELHGNAGVPSPSGSPNLAARRPLIQTDLLVASAFRGCPVGASLPATGPSVHQYAPTGLVSVQGGLLGIGITTVTV